MPPASDEGFAPIGQQERGRAFRRAGFKSGFRLQRKQKLNEIFLVAAL